MILKTKKQLRKAKEAKIAKDQDVPTPTWEELEAEEMELPPKVYFEIKNQSGEVVSRVNGSTSKGLHRVTWNLRYSGITRFGGPMVAPGEFTAQAYKSVEGEITKLGESRKFEVVSIVDPAIEPQDVADTIAFQKEVAKFSNSVGAASSLLNEGLEQIAEIKSTIASSPNGTPELVKEARTLELALKAASRSLNGDQVKSSRHEQVVPSIGQRVRGALFGTMRNTYGVTETQREQVEIARDEFGTVSEEIKNLLDVDLKVFQIVLDEATIPWTKGRSIPDVK